MDTATVDKMIRTGGFIFALGGVAWSQLKRCKQVLSAKSESIDRAIKEYEDKYNISIDMNHEFFKMQ